MHAVCHNTASAHSHGHSGHSRPSLTRGSGLQTPISLPVWGLERDLWTGVTTRAAMLLVLALDAAEVPR